MTDEMNIQVQKQICIPKDASERITSLRFLLILFVLIGHSVMTETALTYYNFEYSQPQCVSFIKQIFFNIANKISVPLLFFISSYLQFSKNDSFLLLLKKLWKCIIVPYLLWTIIVIIFWSLLFLIPKTSSLIEGLKGNNPFEWDFITWIKAFSYYQTDGAPLVFQFWYLRELIILTFFTPFLKVIFKKTPVFGLAVVVFVYVSGVNLFILHSQSLFFFVIGCLCGIYGINLFSISDKINVAECICLLVLCICCDCFITKFAFDCLTTVVLCLLTLRLSKWLFSNVKLYSFLKKMNTYSFFIYCLHAPILTAVCSKITIKIIPMRGFGYLLQFLSSTIILVTISLLTGFIVNKFLPIVFSLLNGSRKK